MTINHKTTIQLLRKLYNSPNVEKYLLFKYSRFYFWIEPYSHCHLGDSYAHE